MEYNSAQEQIMKQIDGQILVVACPGSGKTTTLLRRIHYMVTEKHIDSSHILMITFTKAAAKEMKSRYEKMFGKSNVTFCTIHALCFALLRKFKNLTKDNILSDPFEIIFQLIMRNRSINDKQKFVQDCLNDISNVKNNGEDRNGFVPRCTEDAALFWSIYAQYEEKKHDAGLVDFDDILFNAYDLMRTDPDVLAWMREKYTYIHVDEYQDTNCIQRDFVYLLAGEDGNLVVVGDDDQSIYAFRGARPEIMLHFKKDYPNAKEVYMTTNYRSDLEVIKHTSKLIDKNKSRFKKEIIAHSKETGIVCHVPALDQKAEIRMVSQKIKSLTASGEDTNSIAVLYRTNAQATYIRDELRALQIDFYSTETIPSIYSHWIFQDIVAYFHMATGNASYFEFSRTITHPNRYFYGLKKEDVEEKDVTANKLYNQLVDTNAAEWKKEKLLLSLCDYLAVLKMFRVYPPEKAMAILHKLGGFEKYMADYASYRNINSSELSRVWDTILEDIRAHNLDSFEKLEKYSARKKIEAQNDRKRNTGVCLSTMHKAKGLEWKHVFVIDCVDGVTPYHKDGESTDIEEERRLFYVAMTRAKSNLYLYSYQKENDRRVAPSQFLVELA